MAEVIMLSDRRANKSYDAWCSGDQPYPGVTYINEWKKQHRKPPIRFIGATACKFFGWLEDSEAKDEPKRTELDIALDLVYEILSEFPQADNSDFMFEAALFLARYVASAREARQSEDIIRQHVLDQLNRAATAIDRTHTTPNPAATKILDEYAANPNKSLVKVSE